ncbi:L,D-transpeptidase family protein [Methylobacterium iners]|uniref:L,D-TPase catalytic domain-containing protein n=1 Tax=Methylobacterium iners TaxID=418707 RepID=A0ABQ4RZD6_9HYPH|nr:L,D-transpeptidase [Methylobacterium iners]GJD94998.1 hypothetical protein OCOJLMKI_2206 [Methylobacterium iners]
MTMRSLLRTGLAAFLAAGIGIVDAAGTAKAAKKRDAKEANAKAEPLTKDAINAATFDPQKPAEKAAGKRPSPLLIKVQVLLDRARFSPGAIDGRNGENLQGALAAFGEAQGLPADKTLTKEVFEKLQATSADPVVTEYTLAEADVAGPFVEKIPPKMEQQSELDALGYTNAREMLAERFHMSRDLLGALNGGADLEKAGTVILVAAVPALERGKPKDDRPRDAKAKDAKAGDGKGKEARTREARAKDADAKTSDAKTSDVKNGDAKNAEGQTADAKSAEPKAAGEDAARAKVVRIEVDKETRQVRAFDKEGRLQAFYPASIGSDEKPAPSGTAKVERVAYDPTYTYDPKYAFKGVKAKEKFTIKPGPNNPVGLVWIDLSIPSYGIHGTPEPEKVGKTESHGCIRLTNWDARDLASRIERGATVEFKDR